MTTDELVGNILVRAFRRCSRDSIWNGQGWRKRSC